MQLVANIGLLPIQALLEPYALRVYLQPNAIAIPGSYWGAPEAGLTTKGLHVRSDTPVHSVLHEAAHFICMDPNRRQQLHTDAGGTDLEESAVCYLQIKLAQSCPVLDADSLMADMDAWGYSFRLGSTAAWFAADAVDARAWLLSEGLLNATTGMPSLRVRL